MRYEYQNVHIHYYNDCFKINYFNTWKYSISEHSQKHFILSIQKKACNIKSFLTTHASSHFKNEIDGFWQTDMYKHMKQHDGTATVNMLLSMSASFFYSTFFYLLLKHNYKSKIILDRHQFFFCVLKIIVSIKYLNVNVSSLWTIILTRSETSRSFKVISPNFK